MQIFESEYKQKLVKAGTAERIIGTRSRPVAPLKTISLRVLLDAHKSSTCGGRTANALSDTLKKRNSVHASTAAGSSVIWWSRCFQDRSTRGTKERMNDGWCHKIVSRLSSIVCNIVVDSPRRVVCAGVGGKACPRETQTDHGHRV